MQNPLEILTLYWRGLSLPKSISYELISLSDKQLDDYVFALNAGIPKDWRAKAKADLDWCKNNKIHLLPHWHPNYPESFNQLKNPPWLLSCYGSMQSFSEPAIAVVGSRQLGWGSSNWMESEFDRFLKITNINIISGGARGADQLSHRIAIRNGRATACVLPSGLARVYPRDLVSIIKELTDSGGCLLSCYGPFEEMRKHHFIYRNELIALMSPLVFVVEARQRSGSLMTATKAIQLGREVAVLPSTPNPQTLGNLGLLRDGAYPILQAEDLILLAQNLYPGHFYPVVKSKN